jgi:hypothetical protein
MTGGWQPAIDPRLLLGLHVAVLAGSAATLVRATGPKSSISRSGAARYPTK